MSTTADLVRRLLTLIAAVASGAWLLAAPAPPQAPSPPSLIETIRGTVVKFEMVSVPAGSVTIGGKPVTVDAFLIGRTEVTWDLYDLFAAGDAKDADAVARPSQPYGAPDYNWGHNGFPVISVTRSAAEAFCKWLSARTGRAYRLPTEAEWVRTAELAAGPGSTPETREAMTWHAGNATGTTHAVAKKKPDALGLYDLFGNAAEWVMTNDDQLVTRGGSFRQPLATTGPAARLPYDVSWQERDPQLPKSRWWLSDGPFVGFRLATSAK